MLSALSVRAAAWARREPCWTNVIGVVRTGLALCTATTLVCTPATALFAPGAGGEPGLLCEGARGIGFHCLLGAERLELSRWLAVALLGLVASGYRPQLTGLLHWWLTFSLQANATVLDGGDQLAALLTLLLVPLTLGDPRTWHWQSSPPLAPDFADVPARFVARSALVAVRLQVAIVYFHAALGKLRVPEWLDGTVLYYWFNDPTIGAAPWLRPAVAWLSDQGPLLALLAWSVLVLELLLAAALFMRREYWTVMLAGGWLLHGGVIVVHGIFSLSVTMLMALVLYLRPTGQVFGRAPAAERCPAR